MVAAIQPPKNPRLVSGYRDKQAPPLATWRCPTCGVILAKLSLAAGSVVEIKCSKCNTMAVREAA